MSQTTMVTVYYNGRPLQGVRVGLIFGGIFGGYTPDFYTDFNGTAFIEHASTGTANIYVDGRLVDSGYCPGRFVVYV